MKIYAIADLHLPGGDIKPMDVFGAHWENHFEKISADWRARVADDDLVLLPGDLSWAMRLEDAALDLARIGALPGRKLILRGNHDYWWNSISRLRAVLPEGMEALQNDAHIFGGWVIAGTRGWVIPLKDAEDDQKIFARELIRLKMSLNRAREISPSGRLVVMTHYPPLTASSGETDFSRMISDYGAECAVYGHLHGPAIRYAFRGELGGVRYRLVSCDSLDFALCDIEDMSWRN